MLSAHLLAATAERHFPHCNRNAKVQRAAQIRSDAECI